MKDCRADLLRAAKIKILAPQKLAKDCLSDRYSRLRTRGDALRFKHTLDSLLETNKPEKAPKVSRRGVPGLVLVDHLTSDDMLIGIELQGKREEISKL
jgi:hypothetical protein